MGKRRRAGGCKRSKPRQQKQRRLIQPSQSSSADSNGMPQDLHSDEAMSILLIFPREDAQSLCFQKAAERLALSCSAEHSSERAMERYIEDRHDLVVIDRRGGGSSGGGEGEGIGDQLVRSMRAVSQSEFTCFLAVTRAGGPSLAELVPFGYNMKFAESISVDSCSDCLVTCQQSSFRCCEKLAALAAAFAALDRSGEAVEIASDRFCIQYTNPAHDKMFGRSAGESQRCNSFDAVFVDKTEDEMRSLLQSLRKGKEWIGSATGKRKSGATFQHQCCILPIKGRRGRIQHYVSIRQSLNGAEPQTEPLQQQSKDSAASGHDKADVEPTPAASSNLLLMQRSRSEMLSGLRLVQPLVAGPMPSAASAPLDASLLNAIKSGGGGGGKTAASRIGSTDLPMQKVLGLLGQARDGSQSPAAAAALDRALELLRQAGSDQQQPPLDPGDRMASDYVGGLMTGGSKPSDKKRSSLQARRYHRPSEIMAEQISRVLENSSVTMQSLSEIPEQFVAYLEGDDEWNYDILELERVTNRRTLVYLGMKILQRFNVCQFLQCSEDTMLNWLQVMQDHYHSDNCYHNATHGADVMQSSAYFLQRDRIKSVFDEMDEVASLLGALVHDLDHPGRTNPFLINSQHRLALLYNDMSVLESHHVSLCFQLTTRDDRINIFKNMSREDFKTLRHSMVDIVLATEMARHFEHVGKFTNQIVAPLIAKEGEEGAEQITAEESFEMLTKPENRTLIKRVLIKCSDISNQCRPLKLCREWSKRISEEYFQQTDEEKQRGLPIVMPVFDRATCNLPQSQTSFIDFFLREMFSAWHAFCDVPQLLENMNNNYAYWKQLADQAKNAAPEAASV
ncbi:hypothetical protein BOX15_Mlig000151g1 [Macrostomum lignano]|uniref:Phosphodiesterase n=2 Tax=Macrostomum lignano TaxID=282301 RepID=A0A267ENQ2_9PLAT|nr:hypothetical protein BOX15_Mlig000151g1 [Macrostomum lignano]